MSTVASVALPVSTRASEPPRQRRWPIALLIAGLAVVYGYEVWERRWLSDDAMIASRTVRELLAGNGPVFNLGERAESDTSTAWTYLVAAATWASRATDPGHIAVLLGIVLSVAGLAIGCYGTVVWQRRQARSVPLLIPAGVLVVLAVPPFWDFGTSGLETPLVFAWLGTCWYLLCRITPGTRLRWLCAAVFVLGLGWLIRPEMAVVSVIFLVATWLVVRPGWRRTLGLAGIAIAAPLGYEIFRAGYYGLLVPLTAVSKDAGTVDWGRGLAYLRDFDGPYHLYVPALLLVAGAAVTVWRLVRLDRTTAMPVIAAGLAGVALIGYVVAIGGDFMHGRMLLPGVFLLLLPVLLLPWQRAVGVPCLLLAGWAVLCAVAFRPAYSTWANPQSSAGFSDERQFYVDATHLRNPDVTSDYYGGTLPPAWTRTGPTVDPVLKVEFGWIPPDPMISGRGGVTVIVAAGLGDTGNRVPLNGFALDDIGLAYPLAAHSELVNRTRPGHEKGLPPIWVLADLAAPDWPGYPGSIDANQLAAARHALTCGALAELQDSVRDPMTWSRFWHNLTGAVGRTSLVVPDDPIVAEQRFCRG